MNMRRRTALPEIKVACAESKAEADALCSAFSLEFHRSTYSLISHTENKESMRVLPSETTAGVYSIMMDEELHTQLQDAIYRFWKGWKAHRKFVVEAGGIH